MAGGDVQLRQPVGLLYNELGDDGGTKHPPYSQAHTGSAHPLGHLLVHEGIHDSQVALDADASQRRGRAVEVAIETGRDHSTGCLPEHPVVSMEMVVSLEEEGEEEEKVGDSQAAVEDGRGHFSNFSRQQAQDGDVGRDPDNDHQHINNGDDPGAERAVEVDQCTVA